MGYRMAPGVNGAPVYLAEPGYDFVMDLHF